MNNRITSPSTTERVSFGLIAWLEKTRVVLPLKGVECNFNVCGEVVSVEIDQIFEQNNRQPLDCLYSFPLPASAAVYRCEMHVNGRVIRARVEERERARVIAQEKKAEGYRTALVEMERDNLFALSLGNVQPGDLVVIRFAFFQTVTRLGDWTSFRIPFCPGIRYIPGIPLLRSPKGRGTEDDTDQVPDASCISPPRIDSLHPDAAYLSVAGTIEHAQEITGLSSPSHPVLVRPGKNSATVTIANQGAVPDSDFIVRWTEHPSEQIKTAGWAVRNEDETFALVRFRAPDQVGASETYAQDFYFLIDRSGSMSGTKWQKAVQAFGAFLGIMGPKDRVWASLFADEVQDFSEKPEFSSAIKSDPQFGHLEALGARGGTQLLPALEHVLAKVPAHSVDRPYCLIVITDGEVGNEDEILKRLAGVAGLRVHVFGIDATINDGFLQKLAAQHDGSSCLLSSADDIVGAVTRLGNRLRRPVLAGMRLKGDWEPATHVPDLYAGDILALPLKHRRGAVGESRVNLEAWLPDGTAWSYQFDLVKADPAAVPLLWAKRRIDLLLAQGNTKEAIDMARKSNIVCEGAAFIAWDDTEKVPVSSCELYQPAVNPCDIVFGLTEHGRRFKKSSMANFFTPSQSLLDNDWGTAGVMPANKISNRAFGSGEGLLRDLIPSEVASLFKSAAGLRFQDCVEEWLRSETGKMIEKLTDLAGLFLRQPGRLLPELIDAISNWVRREMPQPFKDRALKALLELRVEANASRRG